MMLTKDDSYQGEDGAGHHVCHYRGKAQTVMTLKRKKIKVVAEGLCLVSELKPGGKS